MKQIRYLLLILIVVFFSFSTASTETKVLIRCDDIGMCHTVNMAAKKLIQKGVVFSASVMVACPWYEEAVEILKAHPEVGVGVHLTLNSEWKHYRWGPVSGKEAVPSLVEKNGYFRKSEADFAAADVKIPEVEKELRAQIEKAKNSGLRIDYIDYHMGTAVSTPELRALVEKLADEYGVGISRYFNEAYDTLWPIPPGKKLSTLLEIMDKLKPGEVNLIVIHLGMETPEMQALIDMNAPDEPFPVSRHRRAELDALLSKAFRKAAKKKKITFVTYKDVVSDMGLNSMTRPTDNTYNK